MCVFIFPGTRPAVGQSCVCGSGGNSWSGAGAGNLGLDGGHLLGVWGVRREKKGEKESGCVCSQLLDILLCASAAERDRGAL